MLSLQPPSSTLPNYLQEDELPQECSDVVSSLPRETGWVANYVHQYQGCWITTRYMKGVLAFQKHFQAHHTDILLVTTPKDSACKIVYLCRNPKDTFVSLWHFTNKLRPTARGTNSLEEAFDKFCRGVSLYGPYWDNVLGYWKKSLEMPQKVLFLKFEEMKEHPAANLRRLAEFLECPFSLEEKAQGVEDNILRLCSFDNLSNLEVNKSGKLPAGEENNAYFRRGEVGDWMNHLTVEMIEKLDRITEEKFHGTRLRV